MYVRAVIAAAWLAGAATALPRDAAPRGGTAPTVKRVAVLPFRGAPELRRPCEEAVALALRRANGLVVVTPVQVRLSLSGAQGRGGRPSLGEDEDVFPPSAEEARELARSLGVDALVSGSASARLGIPAVVVILLAGSSGEPLAQRREGGAGWWPPSDDLAGKAAAEATRAADGILETLGRPASPRRTTSESTPGAKPDPEWR